MWGHNAGIIDANVWNAVHPPTCIISAWVRAWAATPASMFSPIRQSTPVSLFYRLRYAADADRSVHCSESASRSISTISAAGAAPCGSTLNCMIIRTTQAWLEMGTTANLLPGPRRLESRRRPNPRAEPRIPARLRVLRRHPATDETEFDVGHVDGACVDLRPEHHQRLVCQSRPGTSSLGTVGGGAIYSWKGPGQLLLDPGRNRNSQSDWSLTWYTANGGRIYRCLNTLRLDGGVIGWTSNVNLPAVPGNYRAPSPPISTGEFNVNVLGLGGEYQRRHHDHHFPNHRQP